MVQVKSCPFYHDPALVPAWALWPCVLSQIPPSLMLNVAIYLIANVKPTAIFHTTWCSTSWFLRRKRSGEWGSSSGPSGTRHRSQSLKREMRWAFARQCLWSLFGWLFRQQWVWKGGKWENRNGQNRTPSMHSSQRHTDVRGASNGDADLPGWQRRGPHSTETWDRDRKLQNALWIFAG